MCREISFHVWRSQQRRKGPDSSWRSNPRLRDNQPEPQPNDREMEMEFNTVEVLEIEKAANEADCAIRELADLELALVGGGCGEVILA